MLRLLRSIVVVACLCACVAPAAVPANASAAGNRVFDDVHYVAPHVAHGFHPFEVTGWAGLWSLWYGYRGSEHELITIHTHADGRCCYDTTDTVRRIRVRGRRGTLARLVDGNSTYGLEIYWEERPGLIVEVVSQSRVGLRQLKRIAEDVRPASEGLWERLSIATTVVPDEDALRARPRKVLDHGAVGGDKWEFAALLPRGYPLFSWDRRVPCPELRFRGEVHLDRWDCEQFPVFWRQVDDQIFVYGALGSRHIERVRIRDQDDRHDPGVVVRTREAMPGFKFYVARMPRDTCGVVVVDADPRGNFPGDGGGPTGSDPAAKRCYG